MGFIDRAIDKKKAQLKQAAKNKAKSVAKGATNKAKGKHYCPQSSNGKHRFQGVDVGGHKVITCKHCHQLH